MTIDEIRDKKKYKQKISMLTAYDFALAQLIDRSGVDIILVGDSLANVVMGVASTKEVTMDIMIHHSKAVRQGVMRAFLVGDMPYEGYQTNIDMAPSNARRFIEEAGCDAVKLEWFEKAEEVTQRITGLGIPVMGHVGLTPQTADQLGGFKVQGKDAERALEVIEAAVKFEKCGCFSVVLECVPESLAKIITEKLSIPTIGIGAGKFCDGQVLVTHDLLGLLKDFSPKFIKKYAFLSEAVDQALAEFIKDVNESKFPDENQSFKMTEIELKKILEQLKNK